MPAPPAAPIAAPIAAPLPPPTIAPISVPKAAPPPTMIAVFLFAPTPCPPCRSRSPVLIRYLVPDTVTESTSSTNSDAEVMPPPDVLRIINCASDPLGIATAPELPTTSAAITAENVWPTDAVLESIASLVRTESSVPLGIVVELMTPEERPFPSISNSARQPLSTQTPPASYPQLEPCTHSASPNRRLRRTPPRVFAGQYLRP